MTKKELVKREIVCEVCGKKDYFLYNTSIHMWEENPWFSGFGFTKYGNRNKRQLIFCTTHRENEIERTIDKKY